jgi:glucan phosphorylase
MTSSEDIALANIRKTLAETSALRDTYERSMEEMIGHLTRQATLALKRADDAEAVAKEAIAEAHKLALRVQDMSRLLLEADEVIAELQQKLKAQ